MAELKPCPYCGGTNLWVENRILNGDVPQWVVTCMECFQRSKPRTTKNETIEVWNVGR